MDCTGPSLRLEPDNETLQIARRVVTVVQSSKGINNNNHIPRNQPSTRAPAPPHAQGIRSSASTVGQIRPTRNAPPAPLNPAPKAPSNLNPASRNVNCYVEPPSGLKKNPSFNRSSRAPPPPSQPPPANQPVVRPHGSQVGGFRLPNPGALRLPSVVQGMNTTKSFIFKDDGHPAGRILGHSIRKLCTILVKFNKITTWKKKKK